MTDDAMNIFFDIHKDIPREGPGSDKATLRAFRALKDLPEEPNILDVGCGPGAQSLTLARNCNGTVMAVDTHAPFLAVLREKAVSEGLEARIHTQLRDMGNLGFTEESFDLIWSEGAIYIMGFREGLRAWKPLLKKNSYIVVTEIIWLRENPPSKVSEFWQVEYPSMQSLARNLQIIKEEGYNLVGHFSLEAHEWWDEYYTPLAKRLEMLRTKYAGNRIAEELFEVTELEMQIHKEYSDYYGYEFFLMQKP